MTAHDQVVDATGLDHVVEATGLDQVVDATGFDQVVEAAETVIPLLPLLRWRNVRSMQRQVG